MNKKIRNIALACLTGISGLFISACTDSTVDTSLKTAGTLTVNTTTATYNGDYGPAHVVAIWIENSSGSFVKSLLVNAAERKEYLTNWFKATSTGNTVDAQTGATINTHGAKNCTWNGKDASGNVVNDGTYKVCMEFTENNGTGKFASFTFTKSTVADDQAPGAKNGFSNISLKWAPAVK